MAKPLKANLKSAHDVIKGTIATSATKVHRQVRTTLKITLSRDTAMSIGKGQHIIARFATHETSAPNATVESPICCLQYLSEPSQIGFVQASESECDGQVHCARANKFPTYGAPTSIPNFSLNFAVNSGSSSSGSLPLPLRTT